MSSSSSGGPAVCATAPEPCAAVSITLCATGVPPNNCTNPVPPFDAAGVRCILDAFIADAPAHLQVGFHDPISQYATFHDYVLFGDGTVSDEQTGHQDLAITCEHVPGTLRDKAYLTACKASTTDADLLNCFQAAVLSSASGATCTNHLGGCLAP